MSQLNRYEFVGSFLRPERLKEARKNYELNNITKEELTKVEDECIVELVNKLKELGYHTITDGEFRRSTWHLDFMWGFNGVEHKKTIDGNQTFDGEAAMIDDTYMTGKISCKDHPFVEHFKFVKALEDESTVAKQTIPSPGQFYAFFTGAEVSMVVKKLLGMMLLKHTMNLFKKFIMLDAVNYNLMIVYGVVWLILNLL